MSARGATIEPSSSVPTGPTDLSSAAMSIAMGQPVDVIAVERVGTEFGFSGESYRVELSGPEVPGEVIAKLWELTDDEDVREMRFYEELAGATPVRLPHFHHAAIDARAGRGWLVLEGLDDFRHGDDLVEESLDSTLRLVDVVAAIQTTWRGRLSDLDWLPHAPRFRRDADHLADRRVGYVQRFGPITDPITARLFDAMPEAVARADHLLREAPETLLHLDLGLDNVLFLQPADQPVIIDWARCGRGAGVHDLAAILFGIAPLDAFDDVVEGYVTALGGSPSTDVTSPLVRRWLTGAMYHEFVSRTAGVARWHATSRRGLELLDRWVDRTPLVVAAWQQFDRAGVHQLLS